MGVSARLQLKWEIVKGDLFKITLNMKVMKSISSRISGYHELKPYVIYHHESSVDIFQYVFGVTMG